MTTGQLIQSLGFFWLAATALLLSTEEHLWTYLDFAAPAYGVMTYLVGRNWKRWPTIDLGRHLLIGIGGVSLLSALVCSTLPVVTVHSISTGSLIAGGIMNVSLGIRARQDTKR